MTAEGVFLSTPAMNGNYVSKRCARTTSPARKARVRLFLHRDSGVALLRIARSGRAFGLERRRSLRASSRASRTDSETLRLQALDGMPAHAFDALAEIGWVLEWTMRRTLFENGF